MKLVGVTGGFCAGKTTVASFFRDLGAHAIDADKIVHGLYKKDRKVKDAVLKNFGAGVFTKGRIDRRKLGRIAFGNKKNLKKLCGIVHPETIKKIKEAAKKSKKPVVVIDAPLLIEACLHRITDRVVLVKSSLSEQIRRSRARGFTEDDFLMRKAAQMPVKRKIKFADFIINNSKSKEDTQEEVVRIWKKL